MRVEAWPFTFGGEADTGWLPPGFITPQPTPIERELLDVEIEQTDGGYLLTWAARPSPTCRELRAPKVGDTWHETIEDAKAAANASFGIKHEDWRNISLKA